MLIPGSECLGSYKMIVQLKTFIPLFKIRGSQKNCFSKGFIISNNFPNLQGEPLRRKNKQMKPNSKPQKTKGIGEKKVHFQGSETDLPTGIDESEYYDNDISYREYFTDTDVCLTEEKLEEMVNYVTDAYGPHCGHTPNAVGRIRLRVIVRICTERERERERHLNEL
jgi:hypothetical protein